MFAASAPLFDFSPYASESARYLQSIKQFAAGRPLRSAAVEELTLEDDFCRRPLRPEDLDFLTFRKPVRAATVSRLASLASQRMLISLYELASAVPPAGTDPLRLEAFAEFASERNRSYAAEISPFLEAYAFEYLSLAAEDAERSATEVLAALLEEEREFWRRLFGMLTSRGYLEEGLRFILIQRESLAPSKRKVWDEALARGHFAGWPAGSAPDLRSRLIPDEVLRGATARLGIERPQHSYWQFYLPTSLSKCNLLYALARRTEQAFALYGALYAARAEELAFHAALALSCPHVIHGPGGERLDPERASASFLASFELAEQFLLQHYGPVAVRQMAQGVAAAASLAERGRWDLGEQLGWLSSIDRYCEHARAISCRIEAECPDIERETFVEPRDMCSTTHVHNDHRLVTIESGVMHFWGNLGMRLELRSGDRVLIPEGRLHGSTVLSPQCTYHQPIIPDEWIRELTGVTAAGDVPRMARPREAGRAV